MTTAKSLTVALALALALATCGAVVTAVQDTTFRTGTRTVAVYTTVTDQGGRLVPDLDRSAFEVDDNGKRQDLTVFANDIQPITVVLMLDRSGSMVSNFRLVEQAAEEFVAAMGPGDKARIGSFSNRIQVDPRDFTSDHEEMLAILRRELQEAGPTPLWNAVNVGITALLHQQGRRVVLIFTDGMDNPANGSSNNNSLKDVMKRAEQEDVMVYAIGLAGQAAPSGGGFSTGYPGGFGGGGRRRGGFGGGGGGGRPFVADKPDDGLPQIAGATGGGYFELKSTDDLPSTFRRVIDELHHQYVLGFAPTNLDGKMHSLTVRVKAGMTARARRSYLATVEHAAG
jgi:VWFA-related protein